MKPRLNQTVILLKEIRSNMRNDVDARVIESLDKAIDLLEAEDTAQNRRAAMQLFGDAVKFIPAVKVLIEMIFK